MVSVVGKPIKVDTTNLNIERGKFAGTCVKLISTKLLINSLMVTFTLLIKKCMTYSRKCVIYISYL